MFWHLRMILAYKKTLGKFTKVLGIEETPPPFGKNSQKIPFFLGGVPKVPADFCTFFANVKICTCYAYMTYCDACTIWEIILNFDPNVLLISILFKNIAPGDKHQYEMTTFIHGVPNPELENLKPQR